MKKVRIKIGKIVSAITTVLVIAFTVVFGVITYKVVDPLDKGYVTTDFMGLQPYFIKTDSMKPVFEAGDGVFAKVIEDANEVSVGDIVSYTIGNPVDRVIVIHRIVDIDENGNYVFQGDANNVTDLTPVSPEALQAKYIGKISKLGYAMEWIDSNRTLLFTAAGLYIIYVLFFTGDEGEDKDLPASANPNKTKSAESEKDYEI